MKNKYLTQRHCKDMNFLVAKKFALIVSLIIIIIAGVMLLNKLLTLPKWSQTSTIEEEQPAGTLESIASSNISYIIMQSSQ